MDKFTYLRSIAIFLCSLVITLPFYSASTFAAVNVVKNSGQANIDGFVDAQNDIWTLKVNAQIAGLSITPLNVKINDLLFDSCELGAAGSSDCTYTFDYKKKSILESSYPLDITVLKDDGTAAGSAKATLFADGSGPRVFGVLAKQKGNGAEVSYTVEEKPADCVGLKKIVFASGDAVLKTLEGSDLESKIDGKCEPNTLTQDVTLPGTGSETKTIRIVAFDAFNHNTTAISNGFTMDRAPPVIGAFSVGLSDTFVAGKSLVVPLTVEVTEEGTTLSVIGTSSSIGMNDKPAVCERDGVHYTCTWEETVDFSKPFSLVIKANDGNNEVSSTVSSQFTVDKDAPSVDFFGVESSFGNEFLVKRLDNEFIALFTETQSGIVPASVLADFSDINAVYAHSRVADSCEALVSCASASCPNQKWQCVWHGINAQKDGVVTLTSARDAVGNEMPGQVQIPVRIDDNTPSISNISIVLAGGAEREYFASKDLLTITFNVTENQGVAAFVNTTDLVGSGGVERATCTPVKVNEDEIKLGRGKVACTYTTKPLKSGHDADARVQVIARDRVGNLVKKTVRIEVFGTDDTSLPEFWGKGTVKCSPEGLDINTVKLATQRVFCSVEFSTGSSDVTMASAQLVGCVAVESKKTKAAAKATGAGKPTVGAFAGGEAIDLPFDGGASAQGDADETTAVGIAAPTVGVVPSTGTTSAAGAPRLSDALPAAAQDTFVDPLQDDNTASGVSDKNKKETKPTANKPIADNHLKSSYLINNLFGSATPYVVLEFDPNAFVETKADDEAPPIVEADGKTSKPAAKNTPKEVDQLTYECVLRLTSKDGDKIILQPEEEIVLINVPFFLTKFDSDLKGLDRTIEREKKAISSGFFGVIGALNEILTWLKIICTFVQVLRTALIAIQSVYYSLGAVGKTPAPGVKQGTMLACVAMSEGVMKTGESIFIVLDTICGLATCSSSPVGWYKNWQDAILRYYNVATGRNLIGLVGGAAAVRKASSLQDNLVLSVVGLCLPGVVLNLNKLRQIDCRYVACLQNDVKSGVATVEACRELRDYQECKYIWGEVFQFIPLVGFVDYVANLIKSLITDPIGDLRLFLFVATTACATQCAADEAYVGACNTAQVLVWIIDISNSIIGALDQIEVTTKGDYCKQVGIKAF